MTSYFIEEEGGEILYYGEIKEQEDSDSDPVKHGKGMIFNLGTGCLVEGWFKDDEQWGYRRKINGNLQYHIGYNQEGVREGFGRYYFPSGAKQIDIYHREKAEGFGIYIYPKGDQIYEGMYVADKR